MQGEPTGLYVHVPFCDGKCPYCAFYSIPYTRAKAERWLAAVRIEFERFAARCGRPVFETVYIGGGTPTMLEPDVLARLVAWVRGLLPPDGAAEWSVEANPGSASLGKLRILRRAGVNRLSIGAQAFDDARLRLLGRRHDAAAAVAAVATARAAGFANIGLDLMAGGPGGGPRAWRATLERAVALAPEHLSVYALTVEEGTALARRAGRRWRGGEGGSAVRVHEAAARLAAAGYERYEISNYARPGFACRHHVACWRGGRYLGLGPAASSHVGMKRWTNAADADGYADRLLAGRAPVRQVETLTAETKATERLVFGLRLADGLDLDAAARGPGAAARIARWTGTLERLAREGLAEGGPRRWRLTARGLGFADHVAVELMP